jgi:predicted nucleic acid-binding protein
VVLVDTSVWIDLLRGQDTRETRVVRTLLASDEAALTPVIYQEIIQGASSVEAVAKLRAYFGSLPFLVPDHPVETYAAAGALYVRCRVHGFTPRSPHDCLVARIALEQGAHLLHCDRDFDMIARVEKKLKLYRH